MFSSRPLLSLAQVVYSTSRPRLRIFAVALSPAQKRRKKMMIRKASSLFSKSNAKIALLEASRTFSWMASSSCNSAQPLSVMATVSQSQRIASLQSGNALMGVDNPFEDKWQSTLSTILSSSMSPERSAEASVSMDRKNQVRWMC